MECYLDNAATTKLDPKIKKFLSKDYANPSSSHSLGKQARKALENSRKIIADSLNVSTEEIFFTSGGTESNNLAIHSLLSNTSKKHLITSSIEHISILNLFKHLETKGYKVTYLPVDSKGKISLKKLKSSITKDTALVSIMHINNETGIIQDIESISKICSENNILFHSDCIQSYKKLSINLNSISSISISSHKIHGPKGVGAVYLKQNLKKSSLFCGGKQESSLRPGTENIQGIIAFAEASKLSIPMNKISKIKSYFVNQILKIPGTKINSNDSIATILNVSFKSLDSETLLEHLNLNHIYASSSSACTSNFFEPSHVLKAMHLSDAEANSSIRFSFSKFTTKEEINYTIKHLNSIIYSLRKL